MVQRCGGNTYEQGESRRGEERRGKEMDVCPLTGMRMCEWIN
jgi:hypothetical protein